MRKLFFLAIVAVPLIAGLASAQTLEDRMREQLQSTMTQLHQLQDDQASLQAGKAAAEKERDSLKAELAATKAQLAKAAKQSDKSPELEAQMAKFKDAYMQAAGSAKQSQAERDKLQAAFGGAQTLLTACETKNAQLLTVGRQILDSYARFDFGDAFGANEPFIGTKRVELENLAQDYGDKLYDGKFDPRAVRAPPPQAGAPK
jgi:DNA repair exonuclease SbcCD ATPase subunit